MWLKLPKYFLSRPNSYHRKAQEEGAYRESPTPKRQWGSKGAVTQNDKEDENTMRKFYGSPNR